MFFSKSGFFLEPFISVDVINVATSNHIAQIAAHIYLLYLCRICQCVHGCCTWWVTTDDHTISLIPCTQRLGTITLPITFLGSPYNFQFPIVVIISAALLCLGLQLSTLHKYAYHIDSLLLFVLLFLLLDDPV